jgi:hypothetical protein
MEKAKLNFAHICEMAFLSQEGKLNIIGIFEQVNVRTFPTRQPKMTLVMNLLLQKGKYPLKIRMVKEVSNKEVAKIHGEINCKKTGKTGFINEFRDIQFHEPGQYSVEIWIADEPTGIVNFLVKAVSQQEK